MNLFKGKCLPLVGGVLLFASVATPPTNSSAAPLVRQLVVQVTTVGATTVGTVRISWKAAGQTTQRNCVILSCAIRVPRRAALTLTEVPKNASKHPFQAWRITKADTNEPTRTVKSQATIKLVMRHNFTIAAIYK